VRVTGRHPAHFISRWLRRAGDGNFIVGATGVGDDHAAHACAPEHERDSEDFGDEPGQWHVRILLRLIRAVEQRVCHLAIGKKPSVCARPQLWSCAQFHINKKD